jgi:hypothetical protein
MNTINSQAADTANAAAVRSSGGLSRPRNAVPTKNFFDRGPRGAIFG